MILAFRASDGVNRYEEGANLLLNLKMELRALTMETIQASHQNSFHPQDFESVLAHVVQISLCFCDMLWNITRFSHEEKEGLLTDEDREAFENAFNPIQQLVNVVQAYILYHDSKTREGFELNSHTAPVSILFQNSFSLFGYKRSHRRWFRCETFPSD
eukprot:TRINITY_DN834_c0_g1_i4.p2 TRINITY_DN834_c0_g1~~TRINITY_DN834_c0_g1_i4.p2  ORF type:complete len:158 (-),score=18.44 TRINITY_DN834_c0_g1_i4:2640-3113(-)